MGFIERELERISVAVRARQAKQSDTDEYRQLYAAQRALSWALEPPWFPSALRDYISPHSGRASKLSGE
jgi:hypothetical protein